MKGRFSFYKMIFSRGPFNGPLDFLPKKFAAKSPIKLIGLF
jgi:hypothetical protein